MEGALIEHGIVAAGRALVYYVFRAIELNRPFFLLLEVSTSSRSSVCALLVAIAGSGLASLTVSWE